MNNRLGLKGRAKVSVINDGKVIEERDFEKNLILDQGLNRMTDISICDLFRVCAKGTGSFPTIEVVDGANTYTQNAASTTVTRIAGTRDFTANDVGKLIRYSSGVETTITAFTDATHVEASPAPGSTITTLTITLYSVQQTVMSNELGRTETYGAESGDNSTTTVGRSRTFRRTFIFGSENLLVEYIPEINQYSQSGTLVVRTAGTRDFVAGDVGREIEFLEGGQKCTIIGLIGVTTVSVDSDDALPPGAIKMSADSGKFENVEDSNTYSRAGTTVTRAAGTRDFTAADVGKYIHFDIAEAEAEIVAFTDASNVETDTSGVIAAQTIGLYGYNDYVELGLSDSMENAGNLNMRVVLASPVRIHIATPQRASDQLKVTYELDITAGESAITVSTLDGVILDPTNEMSGNKGGQYGVEKYATSIVLSNGNTDASSAHLEPFFEGHAALSIDAKAITMHVANTRDTQIFLKQLQARPYVLGAFIQNFKVTFEVNEAINNNWRSLMIYDAEANQSVFVFLFNANQKKDGAHVLMVVFQKSWGRDL